ncbi:serine/threonine protein kinase [Synechococcus moorigangaii CMS01]|nr:serine/threonine protein kinase [Synechococcus moorigangaii CMS01]
MVDPLLQTFCDRLEQELRPQLEIFSEHPHHPVVVHHCPSPWYCLGTGNYAAVFVHPDFPTWVVKVYAPDREGFADEVEVYRRIGSHPAFSECYYAKDGLLVLRRLEGTTLYDCAHRGIPIPKSVIEDIDQALIYIQARGLNPHDVHGKNVMVGANGRGLVVDISDFLKPEPCRAWRDLKRAYYWIYRPLIAGLRLKIPYTLLDQVRRVYRCLRKMGDRLFAHS